MKQVYLSTYIYSPPIMKIWQGLNKLRFNTVNNSAKTSFYIPEFFYLADINIYMLLTVKYESI